MSDERPLMYCMFCGKDQNEVDTLVAGPSVFICDECIEACNVIIREKWQKRITGSPYLNAGETP